MFSFDMTVLLKPEFELSSYKPVRVEIEPKPEVNEADIDEQISMLVRRFSAAQQGISLMMFRCRFLRLPINGLLTT